MSKFAWVLLAAWEAYWLWILLAGDDPKRALILLVVSPFVAFASAAAGRWTARWLRKNR